MRTIIFITALFFTLSSCIKAPEFPDTPEIQFVGFNTTTITQGSATADEEILELTFSFTDGDADIGSEEDANVFLTDSRDGSVLPFKVNPIPEQGTGNGISGEITVRIVNKPFNICCTFDNGQSPCTASTSQPTDKMFYSIQLLDRAGHESNIVDTEELTILCN
jgi:hypothetical protein